MHSVIKAEIAQLEERQTEDLAVPGSNPGFGIKLFFPFNLFSKKKKKWKFASLKWEHLYQLQQPFLGTIRTTPFPETHLVDTFYAAGWCVRIFSDGRAPVA